MNRVKLLFLIILLSAGIASSLFFYADYSRKYTACIVKFHDGGAEEISARLLLPNSAPEGKFPALITAHSSHQNYEVLQPASSTLASEGVAVLEIILRRVAINGKGRTFDDFEADFKAARRYLATHPQINPLMIFLSGHSIGANLTSLAGISSPGTAGVISTGYPIEFPKSLKVNLLMASGVFDELHQPAKMLRFFYETINKNSIPKVLINPNDMPRSISPASGARYYLFSFLSDHALEVLDPNITAGTLYFIKAVSEDKNSRLMPTVFFKLKIISRIIFFWSVFFAGIFCFIVLRGILSKAARGWRNRTPIILFILLMFITAFMHKTDEVLLDMYTLSAAFLSLICFNYFINKIETKKITEDVDQMCRLFERYALKIMVFAGIIYISLAVGLYFHAGAFLIKSPAHFLKAIAGIFYLMTGHVFVFINRFNALFLNADLSFNIISPAVWIILAVELIYPGGIGRLIDEFASSVISGIQNLELKIKWKFNLPHLMFLFALVVINLIFWRYITVEGYYFQFRDFLGLLYILFCFVIMPLIVLMCLLRWGKIKKVLGNFNC